MKATFRATHSASAGLYPKPGEDSTFYLKSRSVLCMFLNLPQNPIDGDFVEVVTDGQAAHTVNIRGYDGHYCVFTFPRGSEERCELDRTFKVMAINKTWMIVHPQFPPLTLGL